MPFYLCALRNIAPFSKLAIENNANIGESSQLGHSYIKKQHLRGDSSIPRIDAHYVFQEQRIYRMTNSVTNYLFWKDKIDWCLGFDTVFKSETRPFRLLEKLEDTIFGPDCNVLATEFREWDAFIEMESKSEPDIYKTFKNLHEALDFAKNDGALWHFSCDETYVNDYLRAKRHHWALPL